MRRVLNLVAKLNSKKEASGIVTVKDFAYACYKCFGRGVLIYIPCFEPIYSLKGENEIHNTFIHSYDPINEFVLSYPTLDNEVIRTDFHTLKDFIDIPFVTGIIKQNDPESQKRIAVTFNCKNGEDVKKRVKVIK